MSSFLKSLTDPLSAFEYGFKKIGEPLGAAIADTQQDVKHGRARGFVGTIKKFGSNLRMERSPNSHQSTRGANLR